MHINDINAESILYEKPRNQLHYRVYKGCVFNRTRCLACLEIGSHLTK